MTKMVPWAAALLLSLSAAAAAKPQKPEPTRALANLASYLTDADYPDEAIRNNEQGTVSFLLHVGSDGKPTACSITRSSGSSVLDATTCRIMTERPRFQPARDAQGKAVPDQAPGRITWRLPDDEVPPRSRTILLLWASCVAGEAAKLTFADLSGEEVATRVLAPCANLESEVAREIGEEAARELRPQVIAATKANVESHREALRSPSAAEISKER